MRMKKLVGRLLLGRLFNTYNFSVTGLRELFQHLLVEIFTLLQASCQL